MKVLVTGAAGWVGRAVVPELLAHGHQVIAVVRSDSSAATAEQLGATTVRGDITQPQMIADLAREADGMIHLAFNHDFTDFEGAVAEDAAFITAVGEAFVGTDKPLVITGGTPAVPGRVATERDESAVGPAAAREANARLCLSYAGRGVRSTIVRLPRSVHGIGDTAFVPQIASIGKAAGVSGYVGDGEQRWPAVHVEDAAVLYRLALESGSAGSRYHAIGDEGVTVRAIAQAIGTRLDLPVRSVDPEPYAFLGLLMGIDQPASCAATREELGWAPSHPSLLEDLANDAYLAGL